MLELLNSILNLIISARTFLFNTLKSFIGLITNIPQYVNFLSTVVSRLPPFLLPFATLSISLSVLIFILNKD